MRIRSPLLTRLAARIAVVIVRLLYGSCKVDVHTEAVDINPYAGTGSKRYLYCIWHDQLMMTIFSGRPQQMAGLVSRHQDGSYLAESMKLVGIEPVRGSTRHGGAKAMRQMLDVTEQLHIAITPDGPRGPRREIKNGIVFLASHSERLIIPTAYLCKRCWKFQGSWTDMMIPKPFTRIVVVGGTPFKVPRKLKRDGLERYTGLLQAEMERLEQKAKRLLHSGSGRSLERRAAA